MDSGFTLVGACGIGTISQFNGGSSWCDVEAIIVMWSHVRRGTTIKNPVMFKNRKGGSRSNESATEIRRVVVVSACGRFMCGSVCGVSVEGMDVTVFTSDALGQVCARCGARNASCGGRTKWFRGKA